MIEPRWNDGMRRIVWIAAIELLLIAGVALCVFVYTAAEGGSAYFEGSSKWSTSRQQSNAGSPME